MVTDLHDAECEKRHWNGFQRHDDSSDFFVKKQLLENSRKFC